MTFLSYYFDTVKYTVFCRAHEIWRSSWIHAPLFEDVKPFIKRCALPVYVVTNDDLCYVEQSLEEKNLSVAGIISAEAVRACKPHREILEEEFLIPRCDWEELYNIFFRMRLDHPEIFRATGFRYRYYSDSPNLIFIPEYLFKKKRCAAAGNPL